MNKSKRKRVLMYAALLACIPAYAANDVANLATSSGQQSFVDSNMSSASSNPYGNTSDNPYYDPTPPPIVENNDVVEAVNNCDLPATASEALEEAIKVASIVPDVDAVFNNESEAAQGCFAASSQVLNLAMEIPDFGWSVSSPIDLIKRNIQRLITQQAERLITMGCQIADQALLEALTPVQSYLDELNDRNLELNGWGGGIASSGEGYDGDLGGMYDDILGSITDTIEGSRTSIEEQGREITNAVAQLEQEYSGRTTSSNNSGSSSGNITRSNGRPTVSINNNASSDDEVEYAEILSMDGSSSYNPFN